MLRVRVQYGNRWENKRKQHRSKHKQQFKCYTLVFLVREEMGYIFISFRASFEAAPLRIVATFPHRNGRMVGLLEFPNLPKFLDWNRIKTQPEWAGNSPGGRIEIFTIVCVARFDFAPLFLPGFLLLKVLIVFAFQFVAFAPNDSWTCHEIWVDCQRSIEGLWIHSRSPPIAQPVELETRPTNKQAH